MSKVVGNCLLCGHSGSDRLLVKGGGFHNACYSHERSRLAELEQERSRLQAEEAELRRRSAFSHSLVGKIASFFSGDAPGIVDTRLQNATRLLASAQVDVVRIRGKLRELYDYWPTYPPDWPERRNDALAQTPRCLRCGAQSHLQVDHIIRVGDGGNHLPANLRVLCDKCHPKRHGVARFQEQPDTSPDGDSYFEKKLVVIREAIEKRSAVRFLYRKFGASRNEETQRIIRPAEIVQVGRSLCLRGWCYLRKADRTFTIARMRGVRLTQG